MKQCFLGTGGPQAHRSAHTPPLSKSQYVYKIEPAKVAAWTNGLENLPLAEELSAIDGFRGRRVPIFFRNVTADGLHIFQ